MSWYSVDVRCYLEGETGKSETLARFDFDPLRYPRERSIIVGRQDTRLHDPGPFCVHKSKDDLRLIVASHDQAKVPRSWFRIGLAWNDRIMIENIHSRQSALLLDHILRPEEKRYFWSSFNALITPEIFLCVNAGESKRI